MIDTARRYLSLRVLAILPIILFIPTLVSFGIAEPDALWPEASGVFFHLAVLLLVSRLPGPQWGKAAGYAWVALDTLAGIMAINYVEYDIYWPVRLGAQVFAGFWIITSAVCMRPWSIRIVGVITGIWLGGFSFVSMRAPEEALYPAGLLILVWFALISIRSRKIETPDPS